MDYIATGLALARFRHGFEELYQNGQLQDAKLDPLHELCRSLPGVTSDEVDIYRILLMDSYADHARHDHIGGESLFRIKFGTEAEKPVDVVRRPYGVHLYLYMADLVKAIPELLEQNGGRAGPSILKEDCYLGKAFRSRPGLDTNISVGFRTFPSVDEAKQFMASQDSEEYPNSDTIPEQYEYALKQMELTRDHELEHLHNYAVGLRERDMDEFSAWCIQSTLDDLAEENLDEESDRRDIERLDKVYRFKSGKKAWESYKIALKNPKIKGLDPPNHLNSLSSVVRLIRDLEGVTPNLDKIIEEIHATKN